MTPSDVLTYAPVAWFASVVMGLVLRFITQGGDWLVSLVKR